MAAGDQLLGWLEFLVILTITQAAKLIGTSPAMARRWVRALAAQKRIRIGACKPKGGRAEQWICLPTHPTHAPEHDLAVTDFALQLIELCRKHPDLSLTPLKHSLTPTNPRPDFASILSSHGAQKHLLIFLERDGGTEPIRRRGSGTNLADKLARYVDLRTTEQYRDVVADTGLSCRGFRVLVVTTSEARVTQVCSVAAELCADLIWTTTHDALAAHSIAAPIWTRGAQREPRQSILGSLATNLTSFQYGHK